MPKKRFSAEQIVTLLRQIEVLQYRLMDGVAGSNLAITRMFPRIFDIVSRFEFPAAAQILTSN
jgi:hypothetical protein